MSNGLPFNNKASRALSGAQGIIDERMEDMLAKNLSNSLLKMGPPSSPKLKYKMTQKLKDLMDVNEKLRQENPPGATVFQDKMNQVSNMVNANMAPVNMAVNEQMPGPMIENPNMANVNPPATRLAEMGGLMSMSPQARMNQGLMQFYEPVRRMQPGGSVNFDMGPYSELANMITGLLSDLESGDADKQRSSSLRLRQIAQTQEGQNLLQRMNPDMYNLNPTAEPSTPLSDLQTYDFLRLGRSPDEIDVGEPGEPLSKRMESVDKEDFFTLGKNPDTLNVDSPRSVLQRVATPKFQRNITLDEALDTLDPSLISRNKDIPFQQKLALVNSTKALRNLEQQLKNTQSRGPTSAFERLIAADPDDVELELKESIANIKNDINRNRADAEIAVRTKGLFSGNPFERISKQQVEDDRKKRLSIRDEVYKKYNITSGKKEPSQNQKDLPPSISEEDFDMLNAIETGGGPQPDQGDPVLPQQDDSQKDDAQKDDLGDVPRPIAKPNKQEAILANSLLNDKDRTEELFEKAKDKKGIEGFINNLSGRDLITMGAAFLGTTSVTEGTKAALTALLKSKDADRAHDLAKRKLDVSEAYYADTIGLKRDELEALKKYQMEKLLTDKQIAQIGAYARIMSTGDNEVTGNALLDAFVKTRPEYKSEGAYSTYVTNQAKKKYPENVKDYKKLRKQFVANAMNPENKNTLLFNDFRSFAENARRALRQSKPNPQRDAILNLLRPDGNQTEFSLIDIGPG